MHSALFFSEIMDKQRMVQRRAARWTRSEYSPYASVTQMLQSLGWQSLEKRRSDSRLCLFYNIIYGLVAIDMPLYTETIKLCPLDVYVCQFLIYERISFNFLHYKLLSFKNVMVLSEIHLITNRAADNSENTSTLKIKSHNINSLCVHHSKPFKHI